MPRKRKTDIPTRSEVTERVEKNKDDMEEHVEELDTIASDFETVEKTLSELEFGGTADAADEVEDVFEQAEDVTIEKFDEEDEVLEEVQDETEDHENELQERSDSSQMDLGKISDASGRIETDDTVNELINAKEGVLKDIDFIDEHQQIAEEARDESERLQQEHQNRVHGQRR
jgi:hypothetical protein